MEEPVLINPQVNKIMLYIVTLLSLVIQVYYNKPGQEQMNLHP